MKEHTKTKITLFVLIVFFIIFSIAFVGSFQHKETWPDGYGVVATTTPLSEQILTVEYVDTLSLSEARDLKQKAIWCAAQDLGRIDFATYQWCLASTTP